MDDFATTRERFEASCAEQFANSPEHLSLIGALCDLYEGKELLDD